MKIDNYVSKEHKIPVSQKRIKYLKLLSKFAVITCSLMYISYIPQILSNLHGDPVTPLQPAVAMINAILWTGYGWFKTYKDWPVIISNIPGIIFGFATIITIYIH